MSLKVLLADDSMTAQNMGKKILTDAGYQVIAVSNGAQALKKLASDKPDLVVLDVYMPGYSGLEVCERIKNAPDTARIPVVLCVAKMEPFKPEEGTRVRADAVIVKPFEATDLVARIQELSEKVQRRPKPQRFEEQQSGSEAEMEEVIPSTPPVPHLNVPEELAVEPAVGMDMVAEPAPRVDPRSPSTVFPASFEIEHERQPIETIRDVRMQAADGLSGVFEMPPSKPAENAVPEFEIVSRPPASEGASSPDDVRGQAAAAAHVEPRPEFVVDRLSISMPLKQTERLPEPQSPGIPTEPPVVKEFAQPLEPASAPEMPSFVEPEKASSNTGYTGIYEFAPPRGSLDAPVVETRAGDMRASGMGDLVEPMVSAAQIFSSETEAPSAVAVETAEPAEETLAAVPLPVWVAEEVALDQCELHISLEEEMRAALSSRLSTQHEEMPLDVAAERIAAFTTGQPEMHSGTVEPLQAGGAATARDNFEAMSDDIVCESTASQPWSTSESTAMPEPEAMDVLASLKSPVPDFSADGTVSPDFTIPGHSFEAMPADEFGPPMTTGMVIEAEISQPEPAPSETTYEARPTVEAAQFDQPEAAGVTDQPPHPLGAMAQAIADSHELSSLKGADAEPVVEAIVSRMLEQIKPELIAHVLRELEKK